VLVGRTRSILLWLSRTLFSVSAICLRAYKGPLIGRVQIWLGFFCGVIPRRAATRKTLDGVPIRFFVLKIISGSLWICVGVWSGIWSSRARIDSCRNLLSGSCSNCARVGEFLLLGLHLRWVLVSRIYYPSIDFVYLHDLDLLVRIGWKLRSVCLRDIYSSYPILYSKYCLAWGLSDVLSCCCLTYIEFGSNIIAVSFLQSNYCFYVLCWAA